MNKKVKGIVLIILNIIFLTYLSILSLFYEIFSIFHLAVFLLFRIGKLDDFYRVHNWLYGRFLIFISWPYIRTSVRGKKHIPPDGPYVIVLNHRSFADIFFSSLVPIPNQLVIVRGWVFKIFIFSWAMKLAGYINIDRTSTEELLAAGKALKDRNVSFQFYPEAHRSGDGKLNRFRKGAFLFSVKNNIPVIPVCLAGVERFAFKTFPFMHPAQIRVDILPPVFPSDFTSEDPAKEMRKHVVRLYREYFEE